MFGMYQILMNNKNGDMKVIDRKTDEQTSFYKEKGKKRKDWVVKGIRQGLI